MSQSIAAVSTNPAPRAGTGWLRTLRSHRYLYLMLVPGVLYYLLFQYYPMYGAIIAFKSFNIRKGILGSAWAGLEHFTYLFNLPSFWTVFRNTVEISLLRLTFGFPAPLIFALLLNEVRNTAFKRTVQTMVYLPHFISWIILGGILVNLLSVDYGLVNRLLKTLLGRAIPFLTDQRYFRATMVTSMVWKEYGWAAIIYLAALAGVDPQLYEAAIMDGCGRFRQVFSITLPSIVNTILVVLILRIGGLMDAGFEQIFVMYHPAVYRVADIIDTYVYRMGLTEGRFSLAAAAGLFKSVIGFALLLSANRAARRLSEGSVGVF